MSTEIEIRGPLTESQYRNLLKLLREKGQLIKEADQLAIFFSGEKDNLSLKKDHEKEKLVLKYGEWYHGNREEVEVFLEKGQFENMLRLLKGIGYTKGHRVPAFRQDFLYQDVQVSLKTKAVIGPHYEMETTISHPRKAAATKTRLITLAKKLELKVWTEKEYRRHTEKMWHAYHPGPEDL